MKDVWTFPRTMKKGLFRNRTFQTQAEYQTALRGLTAKAKSKKQKPMEVRYRRPDGTEISVVVSTREGLEAALEALKGGVGEKS